MDHPAPSYYSNYGCDDSQKQTRKGKIGMRKLCTLVLFLILCFAISTHPLVGASSELWSQTYGGEYDDVAYELVETSDGGYALAGYKAYSSYPRFFERQPDFLLVKTDENGNIEWNQTYGGADGEIANSLIKTSDGGYALGGGTSPFGGTADLWLVKTDESGNMEWNKTYGGAQDDRAQSLIETSDGGYALAGSTESFGAGSYDFWLVKVDESGNFEWNKTYGGTHDDLAYSLLETSDGGYALAGFTHSFGVGFYNFWLVKTDENGNIMWNQTYGGIGYNQAYSLVETSDGGYAVAGYTNSYGPDDDDFWLVKTDGFGNMEWNRTYGGADHEFAFSLVEASEGGYALTGYTDSFGAGGYDFWLVKTDENGNIMWNQTYGGEYDEFAYSLVKTSDGGYAIAGKTNVAHGEYTDFWLVKTDANGIPEFPSWIILPLLIVATVVVTIAKKKLLRKRLE
jgi:hypothetical protein